ncbi:hypothetical protein [Halostella litorea]|uniref:hypothetical protein n=1 Tax=Halostella litorea TaxID=2528831 RepID=UPI00109274F3|nr:hypothetical protein [Halostella litorea]
MFWRTLPEVPARRVAGVLELLLDGLAGVVLAGAVTVTLGDLDAFGVLCQTAFYGCAVYQFLPRVLPTDGLGGELFDRPSYRAFATAAALVVGVPLSGSVPVLFSTSPLAVLDAALPAAVPAQFSTAALLGAFFLAFGVACVGTGLYVYFGWWRTAGFDDRVELFDQLSSRRLTDEDVTDARERYERGGVDYHVTAFFVLFGVAAQVAVTLVFLGFLSAFLAMLFPLTELLLLTAGAASVAADRLGDRTPRLAAVVERAAARKGDLEARFLALLAYRRLSRQGDGVVLYLIAAVLCQVLLVLFSMVAVVALLYGVLVNLGEIRAPGWNTAVLAWDAVGILLCAALPGFYGLWYWARQAARVPAYLEHWERTRPETVDLSTLRDRPPEVTRPVGNLLVPSLAFVPLAAVTATGSGALSPTNRVVFGLAWPAVLGVVAFAVRETLRRPPQPPHTDGTAIQVAFAVELTWLWLLFGGVLLPGGAVLVTLEELAGLLAAATLFLVFADFRVYTDRLKRTVPWLRATGDYFSALRMAFLAAVVLAAATVIDRLASAPLIEPILVVTGGLLLLLALTNAVTVWYEARESSGT